MNKLLSFIVAICLIACVSCKNGSNDKALESSVTDTKEELNDPVDSVFADKVLSDWFDYLWVSEWYYGDMLWVISHIDSFEAEPTWDNLQIAKAAVSTAEQNIATRNIDKNSKMTSEDYTKLRLEGYDIAMVESAINDSETDRDILLSDCKAIKTFLYNDVFWKESNTIFFERAQLIKQYCINRLEYLNSSTEYLLIELNNREWSDKLRSFIEENCPTLTEYKADVPTSTDEILSELNSYMTENENIKKAVSENTVKQKAAAENLSKAKEAKDTALLNENSHQISGTQKALPMPMWDIITVSTYNYYYFKEDGTKHYPAEKESLSKTPDGCLIEYGNVSYDNITSYKNMITAYGFTPAIATNTDDGYFLQYSGDINMTISLKGEETLITLSDQNMVFVPDWYKTKQ